MTRATMRPWVDRDVPMDPVTRRRFLAAGAALATTAVGLGSWVTLVEPHWVELVRRDMPLEGLPAALDGATLLQLSDLHVGPRVDPEYLIDVMRAAAAHRPDFVVVTGDFLTWRSTADERELARVLQALPRGRRATFASLGNHDWGDGWRQPDVAARVTGIVEDAGARVLRNTATMVDGVQFAGVADLWSPEFADASAIGGARGGAAHGLAMLDRARPTVVLCHNPDALDRPLWDGVRGWVLAGHTHGGQCRPPFLPPPVLPVVNKRYTAGAFDVGPGRTLYINRGLGYMIRVRFNVRPEVTLFTLRRAPS